MKKEIVILRHNGGQLGNQLLLFTSIYAYCLEKGFSCKNFSFYEYNKYFNIPTANLATNILEKINSFKFYKKHALLYLAYKYFSYILQLLKPGRIIKEDPSEAIYLPPTLTRNSKHKKIIKTIEDSNNNTIYIDGWGFRNPTGLKKYHKQIIKIFSPKKEVLEKIDKFFEEIEEDYFIVGVHIRQGDYRIVMQHWYFNEKEAAEILRAFLKKENRDPTKVLFILCSDEKINKSNFLGLNIKLGPGSMMEDLIALSKCKMIIGSNSTFGSYAAYYSNIPFFIFDRKKKYTRGKGEHLFQYA